MDWKRRKTPLMGLVGGVGFIALIAGPVAGAYPIGTALVLALGIWIIGAMLVHVFIP